MRFLHCSDVHMTELYSELPWLRLGWRRWPALFELSAGGCAKAYRRAPDTAAAIARDMEKHGARHFIPSGDVTS